MTMEEADYARLPRRAFHRYLSLSITVVWQVADLYWHPLFLLRQRGLLLIPLMCIWLADEIAEYFTLQPHVLKAEESPLLVRWLGWAMLIGGMILFTLGGEKYMPRIPQPPAAAAAVQAAGS